MNKGFTLVELVLVVGVIGILAAISLSFLNPFEFQKRARDSVRLRDVNSLKASLILARQNDGIFLGRCVPVTPCDSLNGTTKSDGTGYVDLDLSSYLTQLPADPLASRNSFVDAAGQSVAAAYEFTQSGGDFEIRAHLESADNLNRYTDDGGDDAGYLEIGTRLNIL